MARRQLKTDTQRNQVAFAFSGTVIRGFVHTDVIDTDAIGTAASIVQKRIAALLERCTMNLDVPVMEAIEHLAAVSVMHEDGTVDLDAIELASIALDEALGLVDADESDEDDADEIEDDTFEAADDSVDAMDELDLDGDAGDLDIVDEPDEEEDDD